MSNEIEVFETRQQASERAIALLASDKALDRVVLISTTDVHRFDYVVPRYEGRTIFIACGDVTGEMVVTRP